MIAAALVAWLAFVALQSIALVAGLTFVALLACGTGGDSHFQFFHFEDQIVLPKQPSRGGVGGNPIISIQFLEVDGTPATDPVTLGRCVQL